MIRNSKAPRIRRKTREPITMPTIAPVESFLEEEVEAAIGDEVLVAILFSKDTVGAVVDEDVVEAELVVVEDDVVSLLLLVAIDAKESRNSRCRFRVMLSSYTLKSFSNFVVDSGSVFLFQVHLDGNQSHPKRETLEASSSSWSKLCNLKSDVVEVWTILSSCAREVGRSTT